MLVAHRERDGLNWLIALPDGSVARDLTWPDCERLAASYGEMLGTGFTEESFKLVPPRERS